MRLLAIDTSSVACSVAALNGAASFHRHAEEPREHTRLLMPMIRDVLGEAALEAGDLDGIVLGNGPGSFIGMRIAASVAQGIAFASDIPVIPVSSMACVARQAAPDGGVVAVAQDAHMNEVYFGVYEAFADGHAEALADERIEAVGRIAALRDHPDLVAAGAAWQRYPELLDSNRDDIDRLSPVLWPDARALLQLGAHAYKSAAVAADALVPVYLREKVAQKPADPLP